MRHYGLDEGLRCPSDSLVLQLSSNTNNNFLHRMGFLLKRWLIVEPSVTHAEHPPMGFQVVAWEF